MQILLVVVLGIVERFRGGDFRCHLARITCVAHGLLETLLTGECGGFLLRRERINRRTILGAMVITLTHTLRRVVVFPEYLQQLFIADDGRVVYHAYGFSMAGLAGADFAVGGVWRISARVARRGAVDARQLPVEAFHAPEAAHGKQGDFHAFRYVGHGMAIHGV